jgi:hypothetical protein
VNKALEAAQALSKGKLYDGKELDVDDLKANDAATVRVIAPDPQYAFLNDFDANPAPDPVLAPGYFVQVNGAPPVPGPLLDAYNRRLVLHGQRYVENH